MARSERLGLAVIPAAGWSARDVQDGAREAELAGFDAIFSVEVNNDAMATAQLMGSATQRIQVGTWVANIYLRHSYVCAQGASLIAEATGGRFILGLGVSHQPVNKALQIEMSNATEDVRRYTAEADAMEHRAGAEALSDELLDSICLIGPPERCQQRLAEYRSAGLDMPILLGPLGVDGARQVIAAFRRPLVTESGSRPEVA